MRVLVIKTSALGDILQCFPVMDFLCSHPKIQQVDWVVEKRCAEVVKMHSKISRVWEVDTKLWWKRWWTVSAWRESWRFRKRIAANHYDLVLDLQGNCKSAWICSMVTSAVKAGFGKKTTSEWPNPYFLNFHVDPPHELSVRETYLSLAGEVVEQLWGGGKEKTELSLSLSMDHKAQGELALSHPELQSGTLIVVCPGARWENKRMTREALLTFLRCMKDLGHFCFAFAWGSEEEKETALYLQEQFPEKSRVLAKLAIPALRFVMSRAGLVVSMDSLPLHLAGVSGVPTYSIFGPSSAKKYKPDGVEHGAFQGQCPYREVFEKRCAKLRSCETGACIHDLSGMEVYDDFKQWWTKFQTQCESL